MSTTWQPESHEEGEFGPGAALVLSLFAVLLLVAALGWRDVRRGRAAMPTTLATIAEGNGGEGFFDVGKATLKPAALESVEEVARRAVARARADRERGQASINHLQVIGYASPEGRRNQQLAAERAQAVRGHLVDTLQMPDECVVVASYADSHSELLKAWATQDRTLSVFKRLTIEEQRQALDVPESALQKERRVTILGVYHTDSTCRLDRVELRAPAGSR